jgi:hypothetical protein
MFHQYKVILGVLVYCGKGTSKQHPTPTDFVTEDRVQPGTILLKGRGRCVPVFHPNSRKHAEELMAAYPLQSDQSYLIH